MSESQETRRVRRDELYGSDQSESDAENAALRARLNAQMAGSLDLSKKYTESVKQVSRQKQRDERKRRGEDGGSSEAHDDLDSRAGSKSEAAVEEDEGYEFRLFSHSDVVSKVVLEDEEEFNGDGDIVAKRPSSYYLAAKKDARLQGSYSVAAVTYDDIKAISQKKSWGLELPWRVTQITAKSLVRTGKDGTVTVQENADEEDGRRKRPGKRKRIKLRTRERARKEQAEKSAKQAVEKEEHIKDKKKRLNRLKKLRRRAKGKEKAVKRGEG